ncbi:RNA 2'-phosphotransferase [Haloferula rosea]|uniref:Probable RNA 2'-phosphotransferase n=1 Tax=Haloferula rosea TaxID=490093 RepID=A0A934RCS7_9BACT|nr:RNA 2'-phosphotransferase [Haloferula rosea]MBK1828190.1 RNA 2'-phosphotransferase [Haloferula rosea]
MNNLRLSKLLSLVLRHDPEHLGLQLDSGGWVDVDELLARLSTGSGEVTREHLEMVVSENNKQRFAFSGDGQRIRANQGHSIRVDLGLTPQEPPEILYHGTATRFLDSIREKGVIPGSRQHVHLSQDEPTAVAVGRRHGKPVVLVVRSGEMHREGLSFFLSKNGVWLTDRVARRYLALE